MVPKAEYLIIWPPCVFYLQMYIMDVIMKYGLKEKKKEKRKEKKWEGIYTLSFFALCSCECK